MISDKLLNKRKSLLMVASSLGISAQDLAFSYPDEVFTTHLTKSLVQQAFRLHIDDFTADRLNAVCNIPFNRDVRTPVEYAIDLIYGWLVEDIVYEFLLQNGFDVQKTGSDRNREFMSSGKIKSDLDLSVDGKPFDVYFDAQGYWKKNNKIDIRESKWRELEKNQASIICVSAQGFALIDYSSDHSLESNAAWGGKKCVTINGIGDKLGSPELLVSTIKGTSSIY